MGTAHVFKQNSLSILPLLRTAMSGACGGAGAPGGGGGGGGAPHGGGGGGGGRTLARLGGGGGGGGGGIDGVSDVCESDSDAERCGLPFMHVFLSAPDKSSVTESGDATCSPDGPRGEVPVSSLSSTLWGVPVTAITVPSPDRKLLPSSPASSCAACACESAVWASRSMPASCRYFSTSCSRRATSARRSSRRILYSPWRRSISSAWSFCKTSMQCCHAVTMIKHAGKWIWTILRMVFLRLSCGNYGWMNLNILN